MDKPKNVKRGATVFSNTNKRRHINKQSEGHKLFGVFTATVRGDLRFSEKSKKEKVRSLSAVGSTALSSNQHCEMGCHVSEKEAQEPSSTVISSGKTFKIHHKNFLNDCNGVNHASVPRKLRSAMKKRSRKSNLLDSEKVNHKISGIESPEKDSVKKSKKQGISPNWSPREGVSGPITKDEEEVVETLYALAGMFSENGSTHNSREQEGESLPDNSSVLKDTEKKSNAALEATVTAQGASPCPEIEASKNSSVKETIGQEQPEMVKQEKCNKVALHDFELCLAMGLNMTKQSRITQSERKQDIELEAARDADNRQKQHLIKEQIENEGLPLWPGMSSVASAGQAFQKSFATKDPDWLETALCASKQDLMVASACSSSGKNSEAVTHKSSWKRCAAHVHISHIIRSLQLPKRQAIKESELYEGHQMRAHEGSKHGMLLEVQNLNGMRNGVTAATVRNPHESKNSIIQQQCYYRDKSQVAPTTGVYGPQKQSFNFLSLSAGRYGLKVDNNYNKIGSRFEPLSKLQVPYFQSLAQQHGVMSIPTPQSHYASTTYLDQLSIAGPQLLLQQPQYYGGQLCGTEHSSTVSNKQEHQSFWGVQQAAQVRSTLNSNITRTQYPNWQSGRYDSSSMSPCAQATFPRSPALQEIFGSKITSISGQQPLIPPIQDKWARPSTSFCL